MSNKEYQIDVKLKETLGKEVFAESYKIQLWQDFVANNNPKDHGFINHTRGFVENLKKNNTPLQKQSYSKWQIFVVSYGMNVGSEINGDRPSIIYKDPHNSFGEDIIVIPLTSAVSQRLVDKFDIPVPKDMANKLFQNSYARLRQIRSVSVKKISRQIGSIKNETVIAAINEGIKRMLAIDK